MSIEPVVLLSALEHHMYCPRQCALIYVDGVWAENRATVAGTRDHRRVDTPGSRRERSRVVIRAMPLYSDRYGLSGRADGVEVYDDGSLVPTEHKSGIRHGQTADVQLCGQALCLEEMFNRSVPVGYIWYGGTHRRQTIEIDSRLRDLTISVIEEIRSNLTIGRLPSPVDDNRCNSCQFRQSCLPEVVAQPQVINEYMTGEVLRCN